MYLQKQQAQIHEQRLEQARLTVTNQKLEIEVEKLKEDFDVLQKSVQ